jgi:hypothetical protein
VPASSLIVFGQGVEETWWPTGPSGLPENCTAAAVVTADGGGVIGAVVLRDTVVRPGGGREVRTAAAYNTFAPDEGGTSVFLVLYRNQHLAFRITSGVAVQNVSAEVAQVELRVAPASGGSGSACDECIARIEPGRSHFWDAAAVPAMRQNEYGTARVESTGPVVVVVNDASRTLGFDAGIYRGVPLPEPPVPGSTPVATPSLDHQPLFLREVVLREAPLPTDPPPPGYLHQAWIPHAVGAP